MFSPSKCIFPFFLVQWIKNIDIIERYASASITNSSSRHIFSHIHLHTYMLWHSEIFLPSLQISHKILLWKSSLCQPSWQKDPKILSLFKNTMSPTYLCWIQKWPTHSRKMCKPTWTFHINLWAIKSMCISKARTSWSSIIILSMHWLIYLSLSSSYNIVRYFE